MFRSLPRVPRNGQNGPIACAGRLYGPPNHELTERTMRHLNSHRNRGHRLNGRVVLHRSGRRARELGGLPQDPGALIHVSARPSRRSLNGGSRQRPVYSSPAVFEGKVFVGSYDKNLYAIDAETGKPAWSFATDGEVFSSRCRDREGLLRLKGRLSSTPSMRQRASSPGSTRPTEDTHLADGLEGLVFIASNDFTYTPLTPRTARGPGG